MTELATGHTHLNNLEAALSDFRAHIPELQRWGKQWGQSLSRGGRLLAAGNGGSAAEAQHLTAELVGRYRDDRPAFSAIALHAETSATTAIGNDYGHDSVFARGVEAHGRAGDVLVLLSTSGRSSNLLAAASVARENGVTTFALTGPLPNPLAELCDHVVGIDAATAATVQELHLAAVHTACAEFDVTVMAAAEPSRYEGVDDRKHIVIVGDTLLDRDIDGTVDRISPDSPVPVVAEQGEMLRPGGAGLAALMAARDGNRVTLVTALGRDRSARTVSNLLEDEGVSVLNIGLVGTTPEKTRVRSGRHAFLRLDRGEGVAAHGELPYAAIQALNIADAILIADYGRGVADHPILRAELETRAPNLPTVWDPHPRGMSPVAGMRLVTPNRVEALEGLTDTALSSISDRARVLRDSWQASNVAVTNGSKGAVFVSDAGAPLVVPVPVSSDADPCGAGDRFAVTAAIELANGALPSEAVTRAVDRAARYVASGGVANLLEPTIDISSCRSIRASGVVVATGGCFDIAGHVQLLQSARALGDSLVVLLNSDASVRRIKGDGRPVNSERDRAAVLMGLGCVDEVIIFDEDTPSVALRQVQPRYWVKGGDYAGSDLPEAVVLEEWGGAAVVVPYLDGRSTTAIMKEVVRRGA